MATNPQLEKIIKQLQCQEPEIRDQVGEALFAMGRAIIPELVDHLMMAKDWTTQFRLASFLADVGVFDLESYQSIEAMISQEKDHVLQEKLVQILMQAKIESIEAIHDPDQIFETMDEDKTFVLEWFESEEGDEIQSMMEEEGLPFQKKIRKCGHPEFPSYSEHIIFVILKKQCSEAIAIIFDYFGLNAPASYTGECPACGTLCKEVKYCPECELNLGAEPIEEIMSHPFIQSMLQQGLLQIPRL